MSGITCKNTTIKLNQFKHFFKGPVEPVDAFERIRLGAGVGLVISFRLTDEGGTITPEAMVGPVVEHYKSISYMKKAQDVNHSWIVRAC